MELATNTLRRSITIERKVEAINKVEKGISLKRVANEYAVSAETVRRWKVNKEIIMKEYEDAVARGENFERRKRRKVKNEGLEDDLYEWFKSRRDRGMSLSGPMLAAKALLLNQKWGGDPKFSASQGWLHKWKNRHGIQHTNVQGERLSTDYEPVVIFKQEFHKLSYTFRGHVAPVLTPFLNDSTRSLNLSIIPQYAEFLAERGVTGVLVNGTSGEGPSMSVEERKAVAEAWVCAVKSTNQHLMLQIGGTCLPNVLELAKHAETIGVDSLLCLPELYFKPTTPKQLVEYLQLVGQAAPETPLLYYHIPMFTHVNINMPQFLESVGDSIPSFVGIKFTSTNLEEATQAFRVNNKEFAVFLGSDQIMAGAFAQGMDSAITTTINLLPEVGIGILEASTAGDMAKARELQEKFTNAVIAITKYGGWVETMKVAMGLLTPFDVGPPRAPLTPLSTESVASMKQGLKALGYQVLR